MSVRNQMCEVAFLKWWAVVVCTPSMQRAEMVWPEPHTLGTEFLHHVVHESIAVWYAPAKEHGTLPKSRLGPNSSMASVLKELRVHQYEKREGVGCELLG